MRRQWLLGVTCFLLLTLGYRVRAQDSLIRALTRQLAITKTDTGRVNRLIDLANASTDTNRVSALQYSNEALALARAINYKPGIALAQFTLGRAYSNLNNYDRAVTYLNAAGDGFSQLQDSLGVARVQSRLAWVSIQRGDYATAFELGQQSLRVAEQRNDLLLIRQTHSHLGSLHVLLGDYTLALEFLTTAMDEHERANDLRSVCRTLNALGELYRLKGDPEKAENYYDKSIRLAESLQNPLLRAEAESNLAAVETEQGQPLAAIRTAHRSLRVLLAEGAYEVIAWAQTVMARAQLATNRADSAVYYGQKSWNLSQQIGYKEVIRDASQILAQSYARQNDYQRAYQYQQTFIAYNDTLLGAQTRQQLTILQQNAKAAEQQAAAILQAEEDQRQQQRLIGALIGLGLLGVVALVLWRSNRQQTRTNAQLRQQQAELKAAQNQLIQQEKLASLGELTAGIAHEIQNPLNFVNNFAEVSVELIDEIADEHHKPNPDPQLTDELLTDLRQNLQKISQHGSRASSIVRGMLQHSRASSGQREPTDLNALCEEYLRLAYHGLRAKDKTFNASFSAELDASLGLVTVVPQDLGRVLLNLYTNAFYAVQSRQKTTPTAGYQPEVTAQVRLENDQAVIRIRDNGTGIPAALLSKIFQPFFTTKPTGEGTGLGLSLAYDIITKGHGGTLDVDSQEGQGTTFTLKLPA